MRPHRLPLVVAAAAALLSSAPRAQSDGPDPDSRRPPELDPPVATGEEADLRPMEPLDPYEAGILVAKTVPAGVRRESLDPAGEAELAFEDVPGGIVFGRVARPAEDWAGASLRRDAGGGLVLVTDGGAEVALPAAEPSLVSAALAFANVGASGEWLIDIGAAGEVRLARELVDTAAGLVAVRADLLPHFFLPIAVDNKSVIVDRDVRFRRAPDGASVLFEADLELRYYRPEVRPGEDLGADRVGTIPLDCRTDPATGRPRVSAPEGRGLALIAERLPDAAQLAGWIGFFRWAIENRLDGLDAVRRELAPERVAPVRTPRRITERDRAAWVNGSGAEPPAEIPEWMREHRERVLAGQGK
jgi:hypothetical protein